jgi:NAD(P)-dependent dehydrogenase (short-subunit alcohol dehydrogenase family)
VTSSWTARYPDLTGKAVIVAGDSSHITEIVRGFAANGALLAIVAADRSIVGDAVRVAEGLDAAVLGMTADPAAMAVWERLAPHIEQRLGPIDIAIAIGGAPLRAVITDAMLPDMTSRGRGVLVEIDADLRAVPTSPGVRRRGINLVHAGGSDTGGSDIGAAALLCASDTVTAATMVVTLG